MVGWLAAAAWGLATIFVSDPGDVKHRRRERRSSAPPAWSEPLLRGHHRQLRDQRLVGGRRDPRRDVLGSPALRHAPCADFALVASADRSDAISTSRPHPPGLRLRALPLRDRRSDRRIPRRARESFHRREAGRSASPGSSGSGCRSSPSSSCSFIFAALFGPSANCGRGLLHVRHRLPRASPPRLIAQPSSPHLGNNQTRARRCRSPLGRGQAPFEFGSTRPTAASIERTRLAAGPWPRRPALCFGSRSACHHAARSLVTLRLAARAVRSSAPVPRRAPRRRLRAPPSRRAACGRRSRSARRSRCARSPAATGASILPVKRAEHRRPRARSVMWVAK